jgi:HK97 family phage prohead protease
MSEVAPEQKYTRACGTLDEPNKLVGYIARFGEESSIIRELNVCRDPFVEVILPGAFAKTLRSNPNIRSLYNHERGSPLGCTKAGTLRLWEDDQGLRFENDLPDTSVGRDCRESIKRGDIDGCSFYGFVMDDLVEYREGLPALRTIREIRLTEVTPACVFPAYEATSVAVRSMQREVIDHRTVTTPALSLRLVRLKISS